MINFENLVPRGRILQYLAACSGILNVLSGGLNIGWPSPALPQLLHHNSSIPITNEEGSWIAVTYLFGGVLGALLAGNVLDILGRKTTIILTTIPCMVSQIIVSFSSSVWEFCVGRLIGGISDGLAFCSIPMYLCEIADPEIRGLLGSSITVANLIGVLLINVMGSYLSITKTALTCLIFPMTVIATFPFMPESPNYFILKGKVDNAREALIRLKGTTNVDADLDRLQMAMKKQENNKGRCLDLLTKQVNRRALFIVLGIRAFQQLCGITAFSFYAKTIFHETGSDFSTVLATTIFYGVQIIGATLCSVIVDKVGRRPLLMASIIGSSLTLLTEGCYFYVKNSMDEDISRFSWIPLVTLITFVMIFSIGMQSIPILLAGEMFSSNVKAAALCVADICFCVIATSVSKYFQYTKDYIGLEVPFFTFAVCCFFGFFFVYMCVPETTKKTLEQIQVELKPNKMAFLNSNKMEV